MALGVSKGNHIFPWLPSLIAKKAALNHSYRTFAFLLNNKYRLLQLITNVDHMSFNVDSASSSSHASSRADQWKYSPSKQHGVQSVSTVTDNENRERLTEASATIKRITNG